LVLAAYPASPWFVKTWEWDGNGNDAWLPSSKNVYEKVHQFLKNRCCKGTVNGLSNKPIKTAILLNKPRAFKPFDPLWITPELDLHCTYGNMYGQKAFNFYVKKI